MQEASPVSSFTARILRLHRSELAGTPTISSWTSGELVDKVDEVLAKTSVAESVAVLQIVPMPLADVGSSDGRQEATARLQDLAQRCRQRVRSYDEVGIWNWSIVIVMWGVSSNGRAVESVVERVLGDAMQSNGAPAFAVGAVLAQPGADAIELVRSASQAVTDARSESKLLTVVGTEPTAERSIDRLAGLELALTPVRDLVEPNVNKTVGRIVLASPGGGRVDFFSHPGPSVVDRLLVAIESLAALLVQPRPGWDELALEVPLSVLRASNTTPKVVASVMAELHRPERLAVLLTGPGDANTLDEVSHMLAPIRETGAVIARVWEYDPRRFDRAEACNASLIRLGADATARFVQHDSPVDALNLGPLSLAKKLGVEVLIDGGSDLKTSEVALAAGIRFVTGEAIGEARYVPLRDAKARAA